MSDTARMYLLSGYVPGAGHTVHETAMDIQRVHAEFFSWVTRGFPWALYQWSDENEWGDITVVVFYDFVECGEAAVRPNESVNRIMVVERVWCTCCEHEWDVTGER